MERTALIGGKPYIEFVRQVIKTLGLVVTVTELVLRVFNLCPSSCSWDCDGYCGDNDRKILQVIVVDFASSGLRAHLPDHLV